MKGFIVWLIPLDPSGIDRNKDFLRSNGGKLVAGGKATLQDDGRLRCEWMFDNKFPVPDAAKQMMLAQFTASLDKAIEKKANARYEVEFIE
jgi:hypothetical protein